VSHMLAISARLRVGQTADGRDSAWKVEDDWPRTTAPVDDYERVTAVASYEAHAHDASQRLHADGPVNERVCMLVACLRRRSRLAQMHAVPHRPPNRHISQQVHECQVSRRTSSSMFVRFHVYSHMRSLRV